MVFEVILNCNSLDELLDSGSADEYPDTFGRKTHIERYRELAKKFAQFPVEMGAMQAAIKEWMDEIQEKSKDINKNENKEDRDREIKEYLSISQHSRMNHSLFFLLFLRKNIAKQK